MVTIHKAEPQGPRYAVRVGGAFYTGHAGDAGIGLDGDIRKAVKFETPEAVEAFVAEHKRWAAGTPGVNASGNQPGTPHVPPRPQHVGAFDGYELVEVY